MANSKSLLFGVLVGTVIGGVSVLLSTPTSGKELRQRLRINQKQLAASLSQISSDSKAVKEQVLESTKNSVTVLSDFFEDVKSSIHQWKKDIEGNQKSIQKELYEIENALQKLESSVQHQ